MKGHFANGNQTEYRPLASRAKPEMCSPDVQSAKHSRTVHASKFSINWPQWAFSFSPPSLGLEHGTPYCFLMGSPLPWAVKFSMALLMTAGDYGLQSGRSLVMLQHRTYLPNPWGKYDPCAIPLGLISLQSLPGCDADAKKALQELKDGSPPPRDLRVHLSSH